MRNEYLPFPAAIEEIQRESPDTRTYRVRFTDGNLCDSFQFEQGQFMEVSLPGKGEAPISIASAPSQRGFLELTIRAVGKLTRGIHDLKKGDFIYLRGPYGNSFLFAEIKGRNLIFVAGGIGLPPLRSLINQVFDSRTDFGRIKIFYGARTPDELCFKEELRRWQEIPDTEVWITVDRAAGGWDGSVGVVTELWKKTEISPANATAFVCGPPLMIKFVLRRLIQDGFSEDEIYVTLERYMKCGIGKCGHCNVGEKFVCTDGPVFSYAQIKKFPPQEGIF